MLMVGLEAFESCKCGERLARIVELG
jgi:hypothetical protein